MASDGETKLHRLTVQKEAMHKGRISPLLYGSFIELWDDHVAGMWAEMLNDRSFEGVEKRVDWCYYLGEPNICDRKWLTGGSVNLKADGAFNGKACVELRGGKIWQEGLSVKRSAKYALSGYIRFDKKPVSVSAALKAQLPNESWKVVGSATIKAASKEWTRFEATLESTGTASNAVFELSAAAESPVYLDRVSLMPFENEKGWRTDVVEAIRELAPPAIRWGGCVVDPGNYKWKEGIGPRDLRQPFKNEYWGRIDPNDVGIDEFLQFCELVGSQSIVCVCFSGGAQSAADLVHYCNDPLATEWGQKRAQNGHPKPYGVKYWQIGNELEGDDDASGFIEISKAIRMADPKAVVLSSFPSKELFAKARGMIDYVCPHFYRDDYETIEKEIRDAYDKSQALGEGKPIGIGITEWNFTNPWGRERTRLLTLESALETARFLDLFHRNSDAVWLACRSNMCNSLGDGVIQTKPSGLLKPPAFHVMKLYREMSLPVPVKVEGLPEGVSASACRSEDGSKLTLFLTNLSEQPVDIELDLSAYGDGFEPKDWQAVVDTDQAYQPDAMNHWSAPNRIRRMPLKAAKRIKLPAFSVSAISCQ